MDIYTFCIATVILLIAGIVLQRLEAFKATKSGVVSLNLTFQSAVKRLLLFLKLRLFSTHFKEKGFRALLPDSPFSHLYPLVITDYKPLGSSLTRSDISHKKSLVTLNQVLFMIFNRTLI